MEENKISYGPYGLTSRYAKWPQESVDSDLFVTAVGAWCTLGETCAPSYAGDKIAVKIDEFAEFSNDTRVSLRWDRGVGISWDGEDDLSEPELLEHIAMGLLPDEGETEDAGELRSWHEYAWTLQTLGVQITPDELKTLPKLTEMSESLKAALTG